VLVVLGAAFAPSHPRHPAAFGNSRTNSPGEYDDSDHLERFG
jgi:hypothetical protein